MVDNVDHNACTLNGLNKFHGMGIIATITPKVNSSIIVPKEIVSMDFFNSNWTNWDKMEEIRKHWIKENSFETGWTSQLRELPRFHWSFYVFNWSLWSARNHLWKWYSSTQTFRFIHLKGISGSPYCFRCALCNNDFWSLWMSIARSVQCRREWKRSI